MSWNLGQRRIDALYLCVLEVRERERELSYGSVKQIVKDSKEWTNLGVNSFLLYMEMEYSCEAHQVFLFPCNNYMPTVRISWISILV